MSSIANIIINPNKYDDRIIELTHIINILLSFLRHPNNNYSEIEQSNKKLNKLIDSIQQQRNGPIIIGKWVTLRIYNRRDKTKDINRQMIFSAVILLINAVNIRSRRREYCTLARDELMKLPKNN